MLWGCLAEENLCVDDGERVLMIMAKWWSGINKEKWDESGRENDEKGNKKVLKRGKTIDNPSNIWLI